MNHLLLWYTKPFQQDGFYLTYQANTESQACNNWLSVYAQQDVFPY